MQISSQMTAAVLTRFGGPDALVVRADVPVPQPGDDEVLIEVAAAGVNNTDIWTREGAYGTARDPDAVAGWKGVDLEFPRIQGADIAGKIVAVGSSVDPDRIDERVIVDPGIFEFDNGEPQLVGVIGSERDGGFAEYTVVPATQAHDVTNSPLDDTQLACIPIAYGTAMGMLERAEVRAGERILVTGASGALGSALIQLAVARRAVVTGLTSSGHVESVIDAGAHDAIVRDGQVSRDWLLKVAGSGFDVIADVVGGELFEAALPALRTGGRLVTAGAVAGPVVKLDLRLLYLRQRRLIGSTMHTPDHFRRLVRLARAGSVNPHVAADYPLSEIHQSQERFLAKDFVGRLVIVP